MAQGYPSEPFSQEPKPESSSLSSSTETQQNRRRTNVQQLTCNIDLSRSFYYLFFSFVLIELKPFVLKGKVLGKNSEKVWESAKRCEKVWNDFALWLLPFSFSLSKTPSIEEPPEPKTGTARTVPPPNRNRTELGPPCNRAQCTPNCPFLKGDSSKSMAAMVGPHPHPQETSQQPHFFKERLLQKSEGNFSDQNSGWILWGLFWWIFLGGAFFPWEKKDKKSTQKSTAKFKPEFGSFAAKSHTARIWPWHSCWSFGSSEVTSGWPPPRASHALSAWPCLQILVFKTFRPWCVGQMGETKWEKGVETASCDFLQFPAVSCGSKPLTLQIKDQICKYLRESSANCRFSLLVSPT